MSGQGEVRGERRRKKYSLIIVLLIPKSGQDYGAIIGPFH